ncbi:MAG: haloalkane dehalogenase [Pseudomonadota bacterium]
MNILRTPEENFATLPGFDYEPNYIDSLPSIDGIRIHYLDEGPADAEVLWLCLHGEPTWSYLYRKMIPVFVDAGHRVVAPDFVGFGRSDKPEDDAFYTFEMHRNMLLDFIDYLGHPNIRLVIQDWGGLLGLTLPMERPDVISAMLIMNTALGTGDIELGEGFLGWREFARSHPDMDVAKLMQRSTPVLDAAEAAAYAAPFPDVTFKAGVRRFPDLVPDNPDAGGAELSRQARDWLRNEWTGKSFMAIGMQDPVLGPPAMLALHKLIPNCPPPMEVTDAGHFVQEWGGPIATAALDALG